MCISYYLRGFYDSEGCVIKNGVVFGVVNKKGALDIMNLLNKLGIKSSFKYYNKPNIGNVYYVNIYGKENIMKFMKKVGFTLSRKQNKLENLCTN